MTLVNAAALDTRTALQLSLSMVREGRLEPDLSDYGEILAEAGSEIAAAGHGFMAAGAHPTELILAQTRAALNRAWAVLRMIERMEDA